LDEAEIKAVESAYYGEGVLPQPTMRLSKGYDNRLYIELKVIEAIAVKALVKNYKLPKEVAQGASACDTIQALKDFLDADGEERQQKHAAAKAQAQALPDPDAKTKAVRSAC
jgi:hypothetical protein